MSAGSTLDELTSPLTVDEAETAIYDALAARGVKTTGWKSGGVARGLIAGFSILVSGLSQLQAALGKAGFLARSSGDWLTLVALYVYGVERSLGTFAAGTVTLDNAGGGVYSGDPGDLVVINSTTGKAYRNTEAFSIGALETGVEVEVEAVELGSASSAGAGDIDDFETVLLGVTVTNATALVGLDEEDDATLRARCSAKTGSLSPNGARDAYAYVATSAVDDDGASLGVTRVRTIADGSGGVDAYLATASGAPAGGVVTAIDALLQEQVVPLAVTLTTQAATPLSIAVTYELWIDDRYSGSDADAQAAVAARLTAYIAGAPIGGYEIPPAAGKVYVSGIESAIGGALDETIKVAVTVPAADTDVDIDEAPVVGTVTVTAIHRVTGAVI